MTPVPYTLFPDTSGPGGNDPFNTTHWTAVHAAAEGNSEAALAAMEDLCRIYWYPLYAFVRRQGYTPEDTEDLTQGFFEKVIEKKYIAQVDPCKGRFRAFLLACMKHFLSNSRKEQRAEKRGGGKPVLSLDARAAEDQYLQEPLETLTPDKLFERRWALTLLCQARDRLRQEYATAGKAELYETLKLSEPGGGSLSYREIARKLGKTEGAVKLQAYRLNQRYSELLREEVSRTVASVPDIDEEASFLAEIGY